MVIPHYFLYDKRNKKIHTSPQAYGKKSNLPISGPTFNKISKQETAKYKVIDPLLINKLLNFYDSINHKGVLGLRLRGGAENIDLKDFQMIKNIKPKDKADYKEFLKTANVKKSLLDPSNFEKIIEVGKDLWKLYTKHRDKNKKDREEKIEKQNKADIELMRQKEELRKEQEAEKQKIEKNKKKQEKIEKIKIDIKETQEESINLEEELLEKQKELEIQKDLQNQNLEKSKMIIHKGAISSIPKNLKVDIFKTKLWDHQTVSDIIELLKQDTDKYYEPINILDEILQNIKPDKKILDIVEKITEYQVDKIFDENIDTFGEILKMKDNDPVLKALSNALVKDVMIEIKNQPMIKSFYTDKAIKTTSIDKTIRNKAIKYINELRNI